MPVSGHAVGIMVNEYRAGTGGGPFTGSMARDDFIEFVLTENATAADLAALTFGSTDQQTRRMQGVFEFDLTTLNSALASSGQTSFLAGTIIVVKGAGLGSQNLTYSPTSGNTGNADAWSIELVAGQGAVDHAENRIDGNINMDPRGTVVWVSADDPPSSNIDTSGFIAAIGNDNNPGTIANAVRAQFGSSSILNSSFTTTRTIANTAASGGVSLVASTTSTMGSANSTAQQTWIENSLRAAAVPEPSRALLSLVAMLMITVRRRRAARN